MTILTITIQRLNDEKDDIKEKYKKCNVLIKIA